MINTPIFSPSPAYCTLDWFKGVLSAHGSPALGEAQAIYNEFVATGFNLEIALGQFAAESAYGTKGYAVTTKSWGNQLYASWLSGHAVPYSPGNGYTYARFASWADSVTWGYIPLMTAYNKAGYTTLGTMAAHWLGATVGDARWTAYTNNIMNAMKANMPTTSGDTEVNPVTQEPGLICDCASGGTLYADEARTSVIVATWSGAKNVGLYGVPYSLTTGASASLAPLRIAKSSDPANPQLTVAYYGIDKISNVRPGQLSVPVIVDCSAVQAQLDAANAALATANAALATVNAELAQCQTDSANANKTGYNQALTDSEGALAKHTSGILEPLRKV